MQLIYQVALAIFKLFYINHKFYFSWVLEVITVPYLSSYTMSIGTRIPDAAVKVIDMLENNNDNKSKSATG